ncbi:DUF305 domain-containing protein [Herbaspirillum sp. CAH-3]|uniref:DUF305 domain-containing protein n=1 Tax=Herbaspirillum sp. CAH-3 TaxID=2605746 RepID=UPI0018A0A78E|nr:DUF305 domain-containing protein [Herbaspirillum sp. CAH-3]
MRISSKVALATAAFIASAAAFSQTQPAEVSPRQSTAEPQHGDAMTTSSHSYDEQFLDTMAKHHEEAVQMAELVDSRSAHDQLKQMAKNTIDDQGAEIAQLRKWKSQWFPNKGSAVNMKLPGMMQSMKGMSMEKLQSSQGDEFDAMFLDMMIKHHRGALTMAQDAIKKSRHPEIVAFSKKVISQQEEEISTMSRWKKEWKLAVH